MATSCATDKLNQWKEVYNKEVARLKELAAEGYDIESAYDELQKMNESMLNGELKEAQAQVKVYEKENRDLTGAEIAWINGGNPQLVNGVKLEVVGGYITKSGDIKYKVKYPNNSKVYTVDEYKVVYDQIDVRSKMLGNSPHHDNAKDRAYTKLEHDIWNSQENALILFDKLAELGGEQDEHIKYLRDLLEQITDPQAQILNQFKVMLNMEAESNYGFAQAAGKDPKVLLNINEGSMTKGGMSAVEVYLHEMLHMSVEVAKELKGPLADTMAEMRRLYDRAAEKITVEDLVEDGDVELAEAQYKYMFENAEAGMSEFIAYAMTNRRMKELLSNITTGKQEQKVDTETIWGKVSAAIIKMYEGIRDIVKGTPKDTPMDERIAYLVANMWLHNNQTIKSARLMDVVSDTVEGVQDVLDKGIIASVKKVASITSTTMNKVIDVAGDGVIGTTLGLTKDLVDFVNPYAEQDRRDALNLGWNEVSRTLMESPLTKPLGWLMRPEGSLRSLVEYLKEDDTEATRIEKLGLAVKRMDAQRELVISTVGSDILKQFGKLKHKDQEALTRALLETDVKVLTRDYSIKEIGELLTSDEKVQEEIEVLEAELETLTKNAENGYDRMHNVYRIQAELLGEYMTTGVGDSAMLMNAEDIVLAKNSVEESKIYADKALARNRIALIEAVDKLATMHAIKNANASAKNRAGQLLQSKPEAVENLLTYHKLHALEQEGYKTSIESREVTVKGELKDLKAEYTEVRLAGNSEADKKKMKKMGFNYKGEAAVAGIGVYRKNTAGQASFDKQAVAKINERKEMHNIVSAMNLASDDYQVSTEAAQEFVDKVRTKSYIAVDNMLVGTKPEKDGLVPMRNRFGQVENYGVTMDRDLYAAVTDQDRKAPVIIGKMVAEIGEKLQARVHNMEVMRGIWRDMRTNYNRKDGVAGKNGKEYLEIGPDAKHKKGSVEEEFARRIWKDMPQNMKEMVYSQGKNNKYIAVRRDMIHSLFGMRSPSILNSKLGFMDDTLEHKMNANNLGWAVEGIKLTGDLWQELVSLIKVGIVIKTPAVLVANVISNVYYSFALGQLNPVAGMAKAYKDTKEYLDLQKEKTAIELKVKKSTATAAEMSRLKRIGILQKENPVADLMDAGLFTSVASDTALADLKSQTRLQAALEKKTENVPQIIKDGFSVLYMTEGTGLYNAMLMATAYSDFIARANRYQYLQGKGYPKSVAMKMITDEFVNYNRIVGGLWTWLKEMGFAQFLQYTFGATKSFVDKMKHRPSSMLAMALLTDIPNPTDGVIGITDMGYKIHSPLDIALDETGEFVLTPGTLRALGVL